MTNEKTIRIFRFLNVATHRYARNINQEHTEWIGKMAKFHLTMKRHKTSRNPSFRHKTDVLKQPNRVSRNALIESLEECHRPSLKGSKGILDLSSASTPRIRMPQFRSTI